MGIENTELLCVVYMYLHGNTQASEVISLCEQHPSGTRNGRTGGIWIQEEDLSLREETTAQPRIRRLPLSQKRHG